MREKDRSEQSLVAVLEYFVNEFKKFNKDVSKIAQHLNTDGEDSEKSAEPESESDEE